MHNRALKFWLYKQPNTIFSNMPKGVLAQINRLSATYYTICHDEYLLDLITKPNEPNARSKVQRELACGHHLYLVLEPNGKDQVGDIYNKSGERLCRLGTRKVIRYFYYKNYGANGENPLPASEINRVLHFIAAGDPVNAIAMLTANPDLLAQSGYVIAQTGDLIWDVKPLECALSLGDHHPDMIPHMLPLFDCIEEGAAEKQDQFAKYKDAIENIGKEKPYDFQWIFDIILQRETDPDAVTAALAKDFTQQNDLSRGLAKLRQDLGMRVITSGRLVCSYATVHKVLEMYENHFCKLKAALDNQKDPYDKCRLVWRQVAGKVLRHVTNRQDWATGYMVKASRNPAIELTRTCVFKESPGQSFEPCLDFLKDHDEDLAVGCGWDFCIDIYGEPLHDFEIWPRHAFFIRELSSKINEFSEYYAAVAATASPTRSNK